MIENNEVKLVWDSTIVPSGHVPHNRRDITIVLKDKHQWLMVDVAVPDDQNIVTIERYQPLKYSGYTR